ncbi:MAG: hypothetical protein ABFD76_10930 [Smithella sp.]
MITYDPYKDFADYDWMIQKDPEREELFMHVFQNHRIFNMHDCA